MMVAGVICAFVLLAVAASVMAGSSRSTERLLWGSVLCSVGLATAVELSQGGYYGVVMLSAFLVTDLVLYLGFRTLNLLPARTAANPRADRLYRIFFFWIALCVAAGGVLALLQNDGWLPPADSSSPGLNILHERIWTTDWIFLGIPAFSMLVVVIGGFYLVRKER